MYCKNCGKQFEGKFCPECGTPMQETPNQKEPTQKQKSEPRPIYQGADIIDPPKNPKKTWLTIATVLLVLMVIFAMMKIEIMSVIGVVSFGGAIAYLVMAIVNSKKKKPSKGLFIGMAVCLFLTFGAAMSSPSETEPKPVSGQTAKPSVSESSESVTPESKNARPEAPKYIVFESELSSGNYTSGIDFPAGKYDIVAILGTGNVSSSNMFSGGINAMMGEKGSGDLFEQKYSNIKLDDGVTLKISGGVVVKIHSEAAAGTPLEKRNQPLTETVSLGNGNFVAGEDFPAGTYDVVAVSGSGNVSSDNMFDGGLNAMMGTSGDLFEGRYKNIELPEGTTVTISGVEIQLEPSK